MRFCSLVGQIALENNFVVTIQKYYCIHGAKEGIAGRRPTMHEVAPTTNYYLSSGCQQN